MRKGRANDPGRKNRIREAAAAVISNEGVDAASYRRIAARAGVPLGSMTYYYPSLAGLIEDAFAFVGEQGRPRYDVPIREAGDRDAAIEVLAEVTSGGRRPSEDQLRLFREMYHYGTRSPATAELVRRFEDEAIDALRTHFTEPAAHAIDSLVEGWWIYQSCNPTPLGPDTVRRAFTALAREFDI
jgi:DNA-binding transcriptional regulator YbjK